jgi:hypothetical protein
LKAEYLNDSAGYLNIDPHLHLTIATDVMLNLTFSCTERGVMDLILTVTWTKRYNKENALYVGRENPRFYREHGIVWDVRKKHNIQKITLVCKHNHFSQNPEVSFAFT